VVILPKINEEFPRERLVLYYYWNLTPVVKEIDYKAYQKAIQSTGYIRIHILFVMKKGLVDEYSDKFDLGRRHSLNAQEILERVNERIDSPTSIQNIHFHLNKLIKFNLLEIVGNFVEGNHSIKYFCRTAKWFKTSQTSHEEAISRQNEIISKLLNDKVKIKKSDERMMDEILVSRKDANLNAEKWIETNFEALHAFNFDFNFLQDLLQEIFMVGTKASKNLEVVSDKINLWEEN
jgi:hypothetical protein